MNANANISLEALASQVAIARMKLEQTKLQYAWLHQ